ncbi:PMR5 N-terminal domain [Arabidopsis thaliana x Arabidopsis arenosa]|uniref:PMR5 N-terminal domain n=1 Tax=Arabidopsis thaliana x Arabidopsis arenosa TaxID=1240361 RepID=A0A8T1YVE2_9BRAS|nr:PMR5 N-terminal domain [Arabidopsis thaliana x Arabidopsis arenosa]
MASDAVKYMPIHGGGTTTTTAADIKSFFSALKPKKTSTFAYAFVITFVSFTLFFAFSPSPNSSSPWFSNIFTSSSTTTTSVSDNTSGSQFSSIFSYILPNVTSTKPTNRSSDATDRISVNATSSPLNSNSKNGTLQAPAPETHTPIAKNSTFESPIVNETNPVAKNNTLSHPLLSDKSSTTGSNNQSRTTTDTATVKRNQTTVPAPSKTPVSVDLKTNSSSSSNSSTASSTPEKQTKNVDLVSSVKQEIEKWSESLKNCEFFDGEWIKDDSYPLYKPGSCKLIDEQFNCISNGRPDKDFQKLKWKPKKCSLPRLNGAILLEMLRGRRLVFVGDSLNRNMWESLVCILKGSVKDETKVYEARGRHHFRGEAEYSFVFQDYNCTVEFFVSPFLVQEWEIVDKKGTKKETLRLDLVGKSSEQYKGADIIVFNTGHWWTHEKTSKGEDYYQEGSNVYHELAVLEAFRKALTTWGRWVEKNVNPAKSLVFFRGYSASHFSGGQWNSGGACDSETEPIKNDTYLTPYPSKMKVLEKVLRGMKTPVTYLNITRLTDYRKDGHPSVYRKHSLSEKEKKTPLLYQDCSHWCLPGVPDSWNEILYAELLVKLNQLSQTQRKT